MTAKWEATNKGFGRWHVVRGARRLMTLKKVKIRYAGKRGTAREARVRFFNARTTATKEAQRLNAGGKMRKGDS